MSQSHKRHQDSSAKADAQTTWTQDPHFNKGTAFTKAERDHLNLHALLPAKVETLGEQVLRSLEKLRKLETKVAQYNFLRQLQEENSTLFWALSQAHTEEVLPIIYTPTVGHAIAAQCEIGIPQNGIVIRRSDLPRLSEIFAPYQDREIALGVITDGSAILGLGDQGVGGLAISVGKLNLYSAAAGIEPSRTLPIVLDFGTDNLKLRRSPKYRGARHPRQNPARARAQVATVVEAFREAFPHAILQWEDFGKEAAFHVLKDHQHTLPSFNDDIQGTGAMALAGFLRALDIKQGSLTRERVLVVGAGAGGIGVASLLRQVLSASHHAKDARPNLVVVDSQGIVSDGRELPPYKASFALSDTLLHDHKLSAQAPLTEIIKTFGITAVVGLSGQPGIFDEAVVDALMENTQRPIVFALSNPSELCEADPTTVLQQSHGQALIATGSPYAPVEVKGKRYDIAQGNNAFIFPGLGLGALAAGVQTIPESLILRAAQALAGYTAHVNKQDALFPPVSELEAVAEVVALEVMAAAWEQGLTTRSLETESDRRLALSQYRKRPQYREVLTKQAQRPRA